MADYVIIMVAAAAIGFIFAAVNIINAYKIFTSDDLRSFNNPKNILRNKLITFIGYPLADLVFAVLCAAMIYVNNDGYSMSMKIPCYIMGIAALISSVLQGIILKKDIINGALDDNKMFSNTVFKVCGISVISMAALIYFFIQLKLAYLIY